MNTVDIYQNIAKEFSWMKPLQESSLSVEANIITNTRAWESIQAFTPTQGWIQTLDDVFVIENELPNCSDIIISAEVINSEGQSLHLRPASGEQLIEVTFTPNGETMYLMTESAHQIKKGKQTGEATYALYWEKGTQATQPKYSRLVSIAYSEGQKS